MFVYIIFVNINKKKVKIYVFLTDETEPTNVKSDFIN